MEFGFTNDPQRYQATIAYRDAAVQDGWSIRPTYASEPIEGAATLEKDGFTMQVLALQKTDGKFKYQASIHIWGPDGLAIKPGETYNWSQITAGQKTCNECGATEVEPQQFSFAGRCCKPCLPRARAEYEREGWTR
jgi:hypothetical protein